jgi:hypothetical protein
VGKRDERVGVLRWDWRRRVWRRKGAVLGHNGFGCGCQGVDGGGGRAVLLAHDFGHHAGETFIVELVVLRGFDSSFAKYAEFVQLNSLCSEGGQNGVFIAGVVVGEAILYVGRQGVPKEIG